MHVEVPEKRSKPLSDYKSSWCASVERSEDDASSGQVRDFKSSRGDASELGDTKLIRSIAGSIRSDQVCSVNYLTPRVNSIDSMEQKDLGVMPGPSVANQQAQQNNLITCRRNQGSQDTAIISNSDKSSAKFPVHDVLPSMERTINDKRHQGTQTETPTDLGWLDTNALNSAAPEKNKILSVAHLSGQESLAAKNLANGAVNVTSGDWDASKPVPQHSHLDQAHVPADQPVPANLHQQRDEQCSEPAIVSFFGTTGSFPDIFLELNVYTACCLLEFCEDSESKEEVLKLYRDGKRSTCKERCVFEVRNVVYKAIEKRRVRWKGASCLLRRLARIRWCLRLEDIGNTVKSLHVKQLYEEMSSRPDTDW